jgi:hypothetical protein
MSVALPLDVLAAKSNESTTDWLTAIGGLLVFVATVALAVLAYCQIRAGRAQSEAALDIARETREAAQRQWQPRVIAQGWKSPVPGTGDDAPPGEIAVSYYLSNDGTGPAFNVEHGVEIAGKLHRWEAGLYPTMRAGDQYPPMFDSLGHPTSLTPLTIGVKQSEWSDEFAHWTRFENLLGERFEVRNYPDPTRPAEFRRADGPSSLERDRVGSLGQGQPLADLGHLPSLPRT